MCRVAPRSWLVPRRDHIKGCDRLNREGLGLLDRIDYRQMPSGLGPAERDGMSVPATARRLTAWTVQHVLNFGGGDVVGVEVLDIALRVIRVVPFHDDLRHARCPPTLSISSRLLHYNATRPR